MTLNCQGTLIDLTSPKVMGILNLTPDSFYDGGKHNGANAALHRTEKMLSEGATFIDVGAASSRPGAKPITVQEEIERLLPILEKLLTTFPKTFFSVDTYHHEVAKIVLDKGVAIINDISGGNFDKKILETVGRFKAVYVCMHMQGTPETMQQKPSYNAIIEEQLAFFSKKKKETTDRGIHDVIFDPGFGFGKNIRHNFEILKNIDQYHRLNAPLMVGLSRKSMIYRKLKITAEEALNGTTALHVVALQQGVQILRVHDVKEAIQTIDLLRALN